MFAIESAPRLLAVWMPHSAIASAFADGLTAQHGQPRSNPIAALVQAEPLGLGVRNMASRRIIGKCRPAIALGGYRIQLRSSPDLDSQ